MKKALIILSAIALLACNQTAKNKQEQLTDFLTDTAFTNQFERLDTALLNKLTWTAVPSVTDEFDIPINTTCIYRQYYADGTPQMALLKDKWNIRQFISLDTAKNLTLYKWFTSDGVITWKSLYNDFGFTTGISYYFDEQGNLTFKKDDDKDYPFTFEQLKEKLQKDEGITLTHFSVKDTQDWRCFDIRINKDKINDNPVWKVAYDAPDNCSNEIRIEYDAKTGKRIKRECVSKMTFYY